jgi:enoyl-CoA hydratase
LDYSGYKSLEVKVADGIATVTMVGHSSDPESLVHQHGELGTIWPLLDADTAVKTVVITGKGDEFYLSGKPPRPAFRGWQDTVVTDRKVQAVVNEMIGFSKPVISAINGWAAGCGLAVAILADISIAAHDALFFDPHVMLGVSTGDGPGAIWPLFTGLPKAKLYLLTSDALDGTEAERIGLVSLAVPRDKVVETAFDYARRLAKGPEIAIKFTKRGINQWLRNASLISQDYSFALEALSFNSGEMATSPHTDWPPRVVVQRRGES